MPEALRSHEPVPEASVRAFQLWCLIRSGERVPSTDGGERIAWSLDWTALQVAFHVKHPLTLADDHADLFERMLAARGYANAPVGDRVMEAWRG